MSWTNIFMVPLVMAYALGGTVGIIWLIRHYALKQNNNDAETVMNEGGEQHD